MKKQSLAAVTVLVAALVLGTASEAAAQFSSIQQFLFRGLELGGNPAVLSSPQGGPLFDFNRFEQRVDFNRGARGFTYESIRLVGPDSFGNVNTLDLGPLKVQLGGDPAVLPSAQPVGIRNRVGFTTRFIPEVFFEAQTGQRIFNNFSGIATFAPVPMNYTVTFNTGLQDFEWNGNILIDADGRLNALGFYDFNMRLINVGSHEARGFLLQDEVVTDFDLGPINVSGNIAIDALSSLVGALLGPNQATVPRVISGAASRDKVDDLLARLEAGETLSEEEGDFLVAQLFEAAFRADPLGVLENGMPREIPGFDGFELSAVPTDGDGGGPRTAQLAPEPGTLGLLAVAICVPAAVRRRDRRRSQR